MLPGSLCPHFVPVSGILSVCDEKGGMEKSKAQDRLQPFNPFSTLHRLLLDRKSGSLNGSVNTRGDRQTDSTLPSGCITLSLFQPWSVVPFYRTSIPPLPLADAVKPGRCSVHHRGLDPDHPPRPSFFPSSLCRFLLSITKSTITQLRAFQSLVRQLTPSTARCPRPLVFTIVWTYTNSIPIRSTSPYQLRLRIIPRCLLIVDSLVSAMLAKTSTSHIL